MPNKATNPKSGAGPEKKVVTIVYDNSDNLNFCQKVKQGLMDHFTLPESNFKLFLANSGQEVVTETIASSHKEASSRMIVYIKTMAGISAAYAKKVSEKLKGVKLYQYGLQLRGNPAEVDLRNEESLTKLIVHAKNCF